MEAGFDPTGIVACAMRPAGSWAHLGSLVAFVAASWWMARAHVNGKRVASPRWSGTKRTRR